MPDDTPAEGAEGEQGAAADDGTAQPYLGTYRDRTEAERGLAEKDATIGRLASELDVTRRQAEQYAKLMEQHMAAKPVDSKADEQERISAFVHQLAEKTGLDEGGARAVMEVMSSYTFQVQEEAEKRIEQLRTKLDGETATKREIQELRNLLAERDPEWVQNRATAEAVAKELGVDLGTPEGRRIALAVAKREAKTSRPGRSDLPGASEATRRAEPDSPSGVSAEEEAILGSVLGKMTDDERKVLSKKYGRV